MAANPVALLHHLRRLTFRSPTDDADAPLLERFVRCRDQKAFAVLVARHGPMVLRVCRRTLADAHAAEDAFQATFLVLARRAAGLRQPERLAGWLHGVAYRVALKARKVESLRRSREVLSADLAQPAPHPDPLARLTARELLSVVDEEVQRLPEAYRLPVLLCCLEGHTLEEAARLLNEAPGSVRGRLERGRARLRERLARRGLTLPAALAAVAIGQGAAGLPAALAGATVRAAAAFAESGEAVVIPARVLALADEGLKGVALGKMKIAAALVLLAGGLIAGVSLAACQGQLAAEPPAAPRGADAPKPEREKPPRRDLFGDALPKGAVVRLGTMRFRHANGTTSAFAADGKTLLTCGADRALRFWDPATGRLLREEQLPAEKTISAVLSPDGRLLAFHEYDSDICLWDVANNKMLHKLPSGNRGWHQTIFSPDGKTLVAAVKSLEKDTCTLNCWDVETGQGRVLGQQRGDIYSLSFTAAGALMTLFSDNRQALHFWDLAGGKERSRLAVPESVPGAVISPDGRTVAAWSWHNEEKDKGVQFWDAATGKPAQGWTAPDVKKVSAVRFTPDGKAVLIPTETGILVWDPLAGKRLRTLPGSGRANAPPNPL